MPKFKLFLLVAAVAAQSIWAEEAVVNEGKINVRGQPSLIGEVITQLQRGDKVDVLERIKTENPKPGDPDTWAKIKLPANTPVWVFSPFVKDNVVFANRLNLRGGPGENYSVIGRLDKGATVKPIRTIEEWMEIEAPEGAYAFIDASLLKSTESVPAAVAVVPTAQPAATNVVAATPPAVQEKTELQPATIETTPPPVVAAPVATPPATPQPLPQVAPAPAVKSEAPPSKRLVRREGIVRATRSIQAPTWYELIHQETKEVINYLHEEKIGVNLKGYRGQKVVVTGEEAIDPRWPNTPILELETLDFAP